MINIHVKFWGQIKQAAGLAAEDIELADSPTLRSLLDALVVKHGEQLSKHLLDETGSVRSSLLIVIDNEQVDTSSNAELRDGQTVTLRPPSAGGCDRKKNERGSDEP